LEIRIRVPPALVVVLAVVIALAAADRSFPAAAPALEQEAAAPDRQPAATDPARSSRPSRWQVIGAPGAERPRLLVLGSPERVAARGEPISLSVKDADLVEVVRSLARIAGLNLVLDPSVRGTVTAELEDVPWDQALAVILKINGLAMELDGRIITIAPPSRLYPIP
jgi:hypothetical protein